MSKHKHHHCKHKNLEHCNVCDLVYCEDCKEGSMIKGINHIAIVVEDLESALGFWRDALGLPLHKTEENPGENVNIAFLPVGESEIELLEPTDAESGIGKYLAKKRRRDAPHLRGGGRYRGGHGAFS